MTHFLRLGAGLALLTLSASVVAAQSSMSGPSAATTANFCGTVVKLTEAGCIGVKPSMVGGTMYEITSANPKPALGTLIVGSGTRGGVSACLQGTHLQDVSWHKAAACPSAASSGK